MTEVKEITLGLIISWIFGVSLIIAGFGQLIVMESVIGVGLILVGLFISPLMEKLFPNYKFSGWAKFFIAIILISSFSMVNTVLNETRKDVINRNDSGYVTTTQSSIDSNVLANPVVTTSQNSVDNVSKESLKSKPVLYSGKYDLSDISALIYTAKDIANSSSKYNNYFSTYKRQKDGIKYSISTPYAITLSNIVDKIEKYDDYSADNVRDSLDSGYINVWLTLGTSKIYMNYLNDDTLRAVIEYDNDKICKGLINSANSKYDGFNYNNASLSYTTSISASYPCFKDVMNKVVRFVFVVDNDKHYVDVNMADLK